MGHMSEQESGSPAQPQESYPVALQGAATFVGYSTMNAHVAIGYAADRSWTELWCRLDRSIKRLRAMSLPENSTNNVDMLDEVDSFFLACWHLSDWLEKDPAVPEHITKAYIWTAFNKTHPRVHMQVGIAYANTSKHLELGGKRLHARPHRFTTTPHRNYLDLEVWREGETPEYHEAVELAEACLSCWKDFFDRERIDWQTPLPK